MILCDTNIFIEFYKNNAAVIRELHAIGSNQVAITPIVVAELYFGALNKVDLQKIKHHLTPLHHIPLDNEIANKFLYLMEAYSLSHKISLPDALIAATALVHDLELYTLNLKDFRFINGLRLYQLSQNNE